VRPDFHWEKASLTLGGPARSLFLRGDAPEHRPIARGARSDVVRSKMTVMAIRAIPWPVA
jgi:hypothetical protein